MVKPFITANASNTYPWMQRKARLTRDKRVSFVLSRRIRKFQCTELSLN